MRRLYLETTVPGYLTSRPSRDLIVAGHQQLTRDWWESRQRDFQVYISQLVIDEAGVGDPLAARSRLRVLRDLPLSDITTEVVELTSGILASGKIPPKAAADPAHIDCGRPRNGLPGNLELRAHCQCDDR